MGKFNRAIAVCAFCVAATPGFPQSAAPQKGPSASSSAAASEPSRQGGTASRATPASSLDDTSTRNAAARTRMLECGHQWSSMKKAGTASGTWKEFSKVCLTRK